MPSYDEDANTDNFYNSPEYEQLLADNPQEPITDEGPTEADLMPYIDAAAGSGVDTSWLNNMWKTGGKAVDSVSAWAKANPGLTSMVTAGIGNAQKQKYSDEQLAKLNQYKIDAETRAKATEAELYDRRNQSVTNTKPAQLGILGGGMYDKQLDYLKNRK